MRCAWLLRKKRDAMMGNLPYTIWKDATFAHPTLAESLNHLFRHFETETLRTKHILRSMRRAAEMPKENEPLD